MSDKPSYGRELVCIPKSLPTIDDKIEAAKRAVAINPLNAPRQRGLIAMGLMHPQSIALLTDKYWGAGGVDLAVQFLDTNNTTLQNKILAYMNKWNKYGNIKFRLVKSGGNVRIALQGDGYWSYVGTDILGIPSNQPTMTLQNFSLSTPESEYDRVVCHETGHTLGFPHEHERQEVLNLLDVEKTVAWFQQNVGWDRQTTMQQVFSPLDPKSIRATVADARSIMCYQFPGACTKSGQAIPGGNVIDSLDGSFVASIYPPVTAPPPTGGGGSAATMPDSIGVSIGGLSNWSNGGEVDSVAQGTCSVRVTKKGQASAAEIVANAVETNFFNEFTTTKQEDELCTILPHQNFTIPRTIWTWLYSVGFDLIPYVVSHAPTVVPIIIQDIRDRKTLLEIENDVKKAISSIVG